jgi:hypothetical protein
MRQSSSSKKSRSWLDSLEIDVKTDIEPNQSANAIGFLSGIEPMKRRGLLALHEVSCKKMKQEEFLRGYREEEAAQADLFCNKRPFHALDIKAKLEVQPIQNEFALLESARKAFKNDLDENGCDDVDNPSNLEEPWILRMGVYEKIMGHFQHFYNNHDNFSITSLLLYPFCAPDVVRTINFWLGENQPPLVQAHSSMSSMKSHTIEGAELILGGFSRIFGMLPDCMILFRSIKVNHTLDGRVILQAPYNYFFKMVTSHAAIKSEPDITFTTPSVPSTPNMVDVHLRGCLEMHFTCTNRIGFIQDHILGCEFSDNTATVDDLVKYMGY